MADHDHEGEWEGRYEVLSESGSVVYCMKSKKKTIEKRLDQKRKKRKKKKKEKKKNYIDQAGKIKLQKEKLTEGQQPLDCTCTFLQLRSDCRVQAPRTVHRYVHFRQTGMAPGVPDVAPLLIPRDSGVLISSRQFSLLFPVPFAHGDHPGQGVAVPL